MADKQLSIRVGFKWTDANDRTWEVYETKPGGVVCARHGARFLETYTRCVRHWIDNGLAQVAA